MNKRGGLITLIIVAIVAFVFGAFVFNSDDVEKILLGPGGGFDFEFADAGDRLNPIKRVCTVQDLDNVRNDLDGRYVQTCDIDLEGIEFEPIVGGDNGPFIAFSGIYDGNGYTINNFYYDTSNLKIGLFLASNGLIKNVKLTNVNFNGFNDVGGLVAMNNGSIINSFVQGSITGSARLGGLVGESFDNSFIDNSSTEVTIEVLNSTFMGRIGGLVGNSEKGGVIHNSYSTGSISSSITSEIIDSNYGGLVGWLEEGEIKNSFATGDINVVGDGVGGLTGKALGESLIENSYATGTVNGNSGLGGLVGGLSGNSVVSNSYALGDVLGSGGDIGGLVGNAADSFIDNSYALGNVNGFEAVGGLTGYSWFSTIENSYSTGFVGGNRQIGGLIGFRLSGQIINSYWDTQTSGQSQSDGGEGRTTLEMTSVPRPENTYVNWNFEDIWDQENGEYPWLRWAV